MSDSLAVLMPGFDGPSLPAGFAALFREGLGGVCLFASNVVDDLQLTRLTQAIHDASPVAVVAIDEEGGDVTRLHHAQGSPYPGNAILGRIDDVEATRATATSVGGALRGAGVDLTLAPVVDVNSNPLNPIIGVRSFGAEPALVARHAAAWVDGVQSTGVAACAKHFPGHGDTAQDSHLSLPVIDAELAVFRARDLPPFEAAIAAGVRTVMTSHIVVPALDSVPATFSHAILEGELRGRMGFTGVIVTDALDMAGASGDRGIPAAAVAALAAGADFLCIGTSNAVEQVREIAAAIDAAVATGELPAERLAEAADRVRLLGAEAAQVRRSPRGIEPRPATAAPGASEVSSVIDVAPEAAALLREARGVIAWLRLEPEHNIAVGGSPWGPFAAGVAESATLVPGGDVTSWLASAGDRLPVIVGKDNHRHDFARAAIDEARARCPVVVVDMGWPGQDRAYADVATFGASRLAGEALIAKMVP